MKGTDLDYNNWLELASHDLGSAEILTRETEYFDIAIYHLHQAVEKLLKAYIVKNTRAYNKTHDLDKLNNECLKFNPGFSAIEDYVLFIHAYLPKVRYPFGDQLSKNDALECLNTVNKIRNFINDILK